MHVSTSKSRELFNIVVCLGKDLIWWLFGLNAVQWEWCPLWDVVKERNRNEDAIAINLWTLLYSQVKSRLVVYPTALASTYSHQIWLADLHTILTRPNQASSFSKHVLRSFLLPKNLVSAPPFSIFSNLQTLLFKLIRKNDYQDVSAIRPFISRFCSDFSSYFDVTWEGPLLGPDGRPTATVKGELIKTYANHLNLEASRKEDLWQAYIELLQLQLVSAC